MEAGKSTSFFSGKSSNLSTCLFQKLLFYQRYVLLCESFNVGLRNIRIILQGSAEILYQTEPSLRLRAAVSLASWAQKRSSSEDPGYPLGQAQIADIETRV